LDSESVGKFDTYEEAYRAYSGKADTAPAEIPKSTGQAVETPEETAERFWGEVTSFGRTDLLKKISTEYADKADRLAEMDWADLSQNDREFIAEALPDHEIGGVKLYAPKEVRQETAAAEPERATSKELPYGEYEEDSGRPLPEHGEDNISDKEMLNRASEHLAFALKMTKGKDNGPTNADTIQWKLEKLAAGNDLKRLDQARLTRNIERFENVTGRKINVPGKQEDLASQLANMSDAEISAAVADAAQPEAEGDAALQKIKKQLVVIASGMSRTKDLEAGTHAWGGLQSRGIGVDVGELSGPGIVQLAKAVVEKNAQVFIDSGAFSLFRRNERRGETEALGFNSILGKYDMVIEAIHDLNVAEEAVTPPLLVMPDVVGDQAASLELLDQHRDWIHTEANFNLSRPIIPIQKGKLSLAQAYELAVDTVGVDNFIVGIPANKAAVTPDEFAAFLLETGAIRIHFLGAASDKNLDPYLKVLAKSGNAASLEHLSADANILRGSLYGKQDPGTTRRDAIVDTLVDRAGPEFDVAVDGPIAMPITVAGGTPKGVSQARLDRIHQLLPKYPKKFEKDPYDSLQWTYQATALRKLYFQEISGELMLMSVDRRGLGTATTSSPDQYKSTKTTHLKEALELMDQDLRYQAKYEAEAEQEAVTYESIDALAAEIKERYGLASFDVQMDIDGQIEVSDTAAANAEAMQEVIGYAEANKLQIWITPEEGSTTAEPAEGLPEYYSGLGFEPSDMVPGFWTYFPDSYNDVGRNVEPTAQIEEEAGEVSDLVMDASEFETVIVEWEALMEPPPKDRKAIDVKLKGSPFVSIAEAQARVNEWRENARQQAEGNRDAERQWLSNSTRTILSLFDYTGNWAKPYAEAGYQVYTFDIKNGVDVTDLSVEWFNDNYNVYDVYGVMAACPCTTFTVSGNRWRKDRHDAKSRHWIREMWGEEAEAAVNEDGDPLYETPHDYAVELVQQTLRTIEFFRPKFWVLENPQGRIESSTDLSTWRTGFQPSNFGDPYTKRTMLWGNFNADLPTANVEPTEGSKMHNVPPSEDRAEQRSETPMGFAYSFFQANNFLDTDPIDRTVADYPDAAGAVRAAMTAGVSEDEVRALMYETYENLNEQDARDALRALTTDLLRKSGQEPLVSEEGPATLDEAIDADTQAQRVEALRELALEAGWEQEGGRLIRATEDVDSPDYNTIVGRTQWLPRADWWPGRPGGYNEKQTASIIEKGINGKLLGKKQREYFEYLTEIADAMIAGRDFQPTSDELTDAGLEEIPDNSYEVQLTAQAIEIDEDAFETAARQYADDDAGFFRAIKAIVDAAPQTDRDSRQSSTQAAGTDLFGDDTRSAQALADETARRDKARSSGQDSVETGDPSDMFSQAVDQVDLADQLAAMSEEEISAAVATAVSSTGAAETEKPKAERANRADDTIPRGQVGMLLSTGDVVLTSTGRETTPFPKVDTSTPRKAANAVKRADQWLLQNAVIEAQSRSDEFNLRQFEAELTGATIPQASKDAAEMYLFDEELKRVGGGRIRKTSTAPEATDTSDQEAVDRTAGEIAKSLGFNLSSAGENGLKGLVKLFGGKGKMSSGLSFDEKTYAEAKPHFEAMLADAQAAGHDILDFIRKMVAKFGSGIEPYLIRFAADLRGNQNAISQRSNLERDRSDTETETPLDAGTDGAGRRGPADTAGSAGNGAGVRGGLAEDDARVRHGVAPAAGERGNQSLRADEGQRILEGQPAGSNVDGRSSVPGNAGISPDRSGAGESKKSLDRVQQHAAKLKAQTAGNKLPVIPGDAANIDETLPYLFDGQREDVKFTEDRFAKPDGYGVLFTNGTGTGKTFTGLGVVRRYVTQGRDNILIVAPSDKILADWIESGHPMGLDLTKLDDTQDAGSGVVVTTYANMYQNDALATREWDLVIADEAHYLMQNKDGEATNNLNTLRALTGHMDGVWQRTAMENRDLANELEFLGKLKDPTPAQQQDREDKAKEFDTERERIYTRFKDNQLEKRPRAVFLSATPFAYEKTIEWANGYLFDFNEGQPRDEYRGYNEGSNRERFFIQHFGYRMRINRLTEPDVMVDRGLMQRQFNTWLKKQKVLSNRTLDVDFDYDRHFVLIDSKIGNRIDALLEWMHDNDDVSKEETSVKNTLSGIINDKFDHLSRRYFLEAIKAEASVQYVKDHMALGHKVVVFHDFKKGGGFNPFVVIPEMIAATNSADNALIHKVLNDYKAKFNDVIYADIGKARSPIDTYQAEFQNVLLYNGDVPAKIRRANVEQFNSDKEGAQLLVAQSAAGKEGISLHDTTSNHKRVIVNLGLPTQPTTAIQQEGRIYRIGQASDAMFRYMNTGTNWEKWAFATTIAQRASAAENLAQGEQARALKDSFIASFQESDEYPAGMEGEGTGGKERDRASNAALDEFDRAIAFYFGTQKKTSRTKAREGADYFATPEPLGLKMMEWAGLQPGERVLEPSAGHGAIARWAPSTVSATAIEPSDELSSRMAMIFDGEIKRERFEDLHVVNKYDAVVMNPPFGSAGRTAIDHLNKAASHLKDGGRVIAILPDGPAAGKKFDKWYEEVENIYLVAEISLSRVTFERAGTTVRGRIVVLDKAPDPTMVSQGVKRNLGHYTDINEMFEGIRDMELPARPNIPKPEVVIAGFEPKPVAAEASGETYEAAETVHGKTGEDLFVAKVVVRLPREDYLDEKRRAKAMGGWYSMYRGGDAIPGFQFKTREARDAFIAAAEQSDEQFSLGPIPNIQDASVKRSQKNLGAITDRIASIDKWLVEAKEMYKQATGYFKGATSPKLNGEPGFRDENVNDSVRRIAFQNKQNPEEYLEQAVALDDAISEATLRRGFLKQHEIDLNEEIEGRIERKDAGSEVYSLGDEATEQDERDPAAIEATLRSRLTEVGIADDVVLKVVEIIFNKEGKIVLGARGRHVQTARQQIIEIASTFSATSQTGTLNHEIIHVMKAMGLIKDAEWRALKRAAKADEKLMTAIEKRYKKHGLSEEKLLEEAIADMHGRWANGSLKVKGFMRTAFERIRQFFEALGNWFLDNGFNTADSVFRAIDAGTIGRRRGNRRGARPTGLQAAPAYQEQNLQRAFHGSPHRFDQFKMVKIGTGEGMQAFGWGLYFAESESLAYNYRYNLEVPPSKQEVLEDGKPIQLHVRNLAARYLDNAQGDKTAAIEFTNQLTSLTAKESARVIENIQDLDYAKVEIKGKGAVYEVEIPDKAVARMLDWDAPLSKQPESVREALAGIDAIDEAALSHPSTTGGGLYGHLATKLNDPSGEAASAALSEAGIPGIKFLDAQSRRTAQHGGGFIKPLVDAVRNKGTRNLVVFSENDITITAINGNKVEQEAFALGPTGPVRRQAVPTFSNEETEIRWKEARKGVAGAESWFQRMKNRAEHIKNGFTRHFIDLPNTAEFSPAREQLRKIEAAPQASKEQVIRILRRITDGMNAADLDLFTRKVVLDDLSYEVEQKHQLPFGFTPSTLKLELAKLDAVIAGRPDMQERLMLRRRMADTIADEMVDAGVLHKDQIKNPAYYRHQVLDYARAQVAYAKTPGKKLKTPHWARRMGSKMDINANLLEAEFEWMQKALTDIAVARTIEWFKTSSYNVRGETIANAKAHNQRLIEAILAKDIEENGYTMANGDMTSPIDAEWRGFKQKIAMGLGQIRKQITEGRLDIPPQHQAAANSLVSVQDGSEGGLFPFLAWILDNGLPGAMGAGMAFKAINGRKAWIRAYLGEKYADPMQLESLVKRGFAPAGYMTWQPEEGRLLFTAKTIPEHVVDRMLEAVAETDNGVMPIGEVKAAMESVRSMLAVGGPKYQMILPEEVAKSLSSIQDEHADSMFEAIFTIPLGYWKRWVLINPRRWFKYNLNNMSGDLDAVIAGNPKAIKHLPKAIKELYQVMIQGKEPSARYKEAVERGVFDSGLTIQEIPDINYLSEFENLINKPSLKRPGNLAMRPMMKIWRALQKYTWFRENWLRYAAYLDYVERLEAGESMKSIGYGAAHKEMVDAIEDKKDRAALLARELVGDYGAISQFGRGIRRKVAPFYSWMEINTKRYWRLNANAWGQGVGQGFKTSGMMGATLGLRVTAYLYLRMAMVYGMVTLYNNLVWGDEEDELGMEARTRLHLIVGRTEDGKVRTLRIQGALSDFLDWFGIDDAVGMISEMDRGRASMADLIEGVAKAPVNKVASGLTPIIKLPLELVTGQAFWPDVFNPRTIRDRARHAARLFSMEHEYDLLLDRPTRGYGQSWAQAVIYERDPGQTAYNRIKGMAYDWRAREKGTGGTGYQSERSLALHNWRLAKKLGDRSAERKAFRRMRALGINDQTLRASIRGQHPLGGLSKRDRARFLRTLSRRERVVLQEAIKWYEEIYID